MELVSRIHIQNIHGGSLRGTKCSLADEMILEKWKYKTN